MTKEIVEIVHGCPVCKGTLRGNPELNYFCSACNILYTEQEASQATQVTIIEEVEEPEDPFFEQGGENTHAGNTGDSAPRGASTILQGPLQKPALQKPASQNPGKKINGAPLPDDFQEDAGENAEPRKEHEKPKDTGAEGTGTIEDALN